MRQSLLISAAMALLFLSSCGGSKKINPDDYLFLTDYNESGIAIVQDYDGYLMGVDRDNVIRTPVYSTLYSAGDGWYVAADDNGAYLLNKYFEGVDTAMCYNSDVTAYGVIWASDRADHVRAMDVHTGRTLLEEDQVEFFDINSSGLVVLRRCGAHKIMPLYHTHELPVYDYMLISPDGSIKAPWGRYKYVEHYSNGRAKFTNEATFFRVKSGLFPLDEFEPVVRYTTQRYGYLDENGDIAIPERFEWCDAFDADGHARADVVYGDSKPNIIIDIWGNEIAKYRR